MHERKSEMKKFRFDPSTAKMLAELSGHRNVNQSEVVRQLIRQSHQRTFTK